MHSMLIRSYKATDHDDVVALWHACNLVVPWNDPAKDIARKMTQQPELFFVVELDGQLVATAMVGYAGHRGEVYYLAVKPEYQNQGIGKALMAKIETVLKDMGCPKIQVMIRRTNADVINYYEELDFKQDDVFLYGKRLIPDN